MSKWNDLPFEIIATIFRNLQSGSWSIRNTGDLQQCALTCPNWRHVAQQMLFSSTTVESAQQFLQLCRVLITDPIVGAMVKNLELQNLERILVLDTFKLIADVFPNVQTLAFERSISSYDYFYELISNDQFPSLTSIPTPEQPYQIEMYFKCLEKKKHLVTSIALLGDGGYEYWKDRLDEFPKLDEIFIELRPKEPINFMYFVEDLEQKYKLSSLIRLGLKLPQSKENSSFEALDEIQPIRDITDLDIIELKDHTIISDDFMLYTMKKFPNLKSFNIKPDIEFEVDDGPFNMFERYIPLSADTTDQFLKYCSNIDSSFVSTMVTEEKTPMIVKNFCSANIDDKTSAKYPRLKIVYERDYNNSVHTINTCYPVLAMSNTKLNPNDNKILVTYNQVLGNQRNVLQLIELAGRYFTHISLKYVPDFIYSELLEFIRRYCPGLKKLSIKEGDWLFGFPNPNVENLIPNDTLTELELKDYSSEFDSNLLLFPHIEMRFPSLQYISLTSRDFENSGKMLDFVMDMPSISLQHLKIDLDFFSSPYCWESTGTKGVCISVLTYEKDHYMTFDFKDLLAHQPKKQDNHQPADFIKMITVSEHQDLISKGLYFIIDIDCNSLKKFTIKYEETEKLELFF